MEKNISYRFAKKHNVLIKELTDDHADIICIAETNPQSLVELRRYLNVPLTLHKVTPEEFMTLLAATYETDALAAQQMVAGMEEEMDTTLRW